MKKNGFTIIEVSLVLAIAGMIMLLAFIALPGLWRTQRDSERKADVTAYGDAVKKWQSNKNRGALPASESELASVRDQYIGGMADPDGTAYTLIWKDCSSYNKGQECKSATDQIKKDTFNTHKIYFVASATCDDNNNAVRSMNARKAALLYRLELDDIFCYSI
jgi:prepilin-type N-terminal cleavage/methylation domain-containing protein